MLVAVCNCSMRVSDSPVQAPSRRAEADIPVSFRMSRRERFMLDSEILSLLDRYTDEGGFKDQMRFTADAGFPAPLLEPSLSSSVPNSMRHTWAPIFSHC